jgi:hypothetical protein
MTDMAVIYSKRLDPAMADHGFWFVADCTKAVLRDMHPVVVFLRDAIHQAKISVPDLCRPFFAGVAGAKGLPVLCTVLSGLLWRRPFRVLDQVLYTAVSRIAISESKVAALWHLSLEHKPDNFVDRDASFSAYIHISLLGVGASFGRSPISSDVSCLNFLCWEVVPTQRKGLVCVVIKKVKKLFSGASHSALIAERCGGRHLYSTCAA